MIVKKIERKIKVGYDDMLRFVIMTDLVFFRRENLIPTDIDILVVLSKCGEIELGRFCTIATKALYPDVMAEEFSVKAQNIRNRISKLQKRGIVNKAGGVKKIISVSGMNNYNSEGNILFNLMLLYEAGISR